MIQIVYAEDLVFTVNSTDYYFNVGQEAIIPVYVENDYGSAISGQLTYTITETVSSSGSYYSSSNTQTQGFTILEEQEEPIAFGIGTSDKELVREFASSFKYTNEAGDQVIVTLPKINIHFVENKDEQSQSQEEQQQSSSSDEEEQQTQSTSETQENTEPLKSEDQMQQDLQNNQASQDSSALKNQMNQEVQDSQQREQEQKEQLEQNSEYQDMKEQLEEQGFNQENEPNFGSDEFSQEFTNPETGEKASLSGSMDNNTFDDLKSEFESESLENDILNNQNKTNQNLKKAIEDLKEKGFNESPMKFSTSNNMTTFQKEFVDEKNNTVVIKGTLDDEEVLEFDEDKDRNLLLWIILIIFAVATYYFYSKYYKKENAVEEPKKTLKPLDYRKEALKILKDAEKTYSIDKKTAYELLAYSVRYFYSHKNKLSKELSNDEFRKQVKDKDLNSLILASEMIEFAKGKDKGEFNRFVDFARRFIK